MRKKWFNRLLLSYLPVFIFVITFIFFVFFQVFGEQSRKEAMKSNEMLSLQAMELIDTSLKAIDVSVLRELATNDDLRSFFKSRQGDDPYIAIRAVNKMKEMMSAYPLIDSMYLVRSTDDFVLSNATQSKADEFSDYVFIQQIQASVPPRWTEMRQFKAFSHLPSKQVVSLAREAHFASGVQGFLVVNVDASSLRRLTQGLFTSQVSFIQVKDRNHELLFANGGTAEGKKAQSSFESGYSGWRYESGFVQGSLVQVIASFSNIWFYVGFIMIALGLVWIIYVTRRHSKPIEQIVDRFSSYSLPITAGVKQGGADEFALISSALDNLMEQSEQYQKQYREDMHLRSRHLFHQLIDGESGLPPGVWREEAERLQLPSPDCSGYRFIMIEMDKYGNFCAQYARNDQNLLKFAIRTVVQELCAHHGCSSWSEWTASSRLAVLLFEKKDDGLTDDNICVIGDQIRSWVEEHLKLTITVGIGDYSADQDGIAASFQTAQQVLKYKYAMGENRTISRADVASAGQVEAYGHLGDIRSLIQLIRKADEGWEEKLECLYSQIQQGMLANDEVDRLLDYFVYNLNREFESLPKEAGALWREHTLPALKETLDGGYTLQELQKEMAGLLRPVVQRVQELQESSQHSATIREMTAFIEQQFANPNMSLDYLSERFHINAKYVSKLFKEHSGQKFVDFLIDIRMKEAQRLLRTTDLPVQDIAGMVGYTSAISFGRIFKKVLGVSPSDFRMNSAAAAEENR